MGGKNKNKKKYFQVKADTQFVPKNAGNSESNKQKDNKTDEQKEKSLKKEFDNLTFVFGLSDLKLLEKNTIQFIPIDIDFFKLLSEIDKEGETLVPNNYIGYSEAIDFLISIQNDLSKLLSLNFQDFWRQIVYNHQLMEFLNGFLSSSNIIMELTLSKVFKSILENILNSTILIFVRLSNPNETSFNLNTEYKFILNEYISTVYDHWIFDIPKFIDLCKISGHTHKDIIQNIILTIFNFVPKYWNDMRETIIFIHKNIVDILDQCDKIHNQDKSQILSSDPENKRKAMLCIQEIVYNIYLLSVFFPVELIDIIFENDISICLSIIFSYSINCFNFWESKYPDLKWIQPLKISICKYSLETGKIIIEKGIIKRKEFSTKFDFGLEKLIGNNLELFIRKLSSKDLIPDERIRRLSHPPDISFLQLIQKQIPILNYIENCKKSIISQDNKDILLITLNSLNESSNLKALSVNNYSNTTMFLQCKAMFPDIMEDIISDVIAQSNNDLESVILSLSSLNESQPIDIKKEEKQESKEKTDVSKAELNDFEEDKDSIGGSIQKINTNTFQNEPNNNSDIVLDIQEIMQMEAESEHSKVINKLKEDESHLKHELKKKTLELNRLYDDDFEDINELPKLNYQTSDITLDEQEPEKFLEENIVSNINYRKKEPIEEEKFENKEYKGNYYKKEYINENKNFEDNQKKYQEGYKDFDILDNKNINRRTINSRRGRFRGKKDKFSYIPRENT